jgi:hypothetical protein
MVWKKTMLHSLGMKIQTWWQHQHTRWGILLIIIGLIERVWLWMVYQPISYGDTGSYMRVAGVLSTLTMQGYDGTRVPGYPAFLALVGMEPERVWLAQMCFGLIISYVLFWITWRTSESVTLGLIVGGLYNLIPGQFLFEANLLTETLTIFWIVLSLALLILMERVKNHAIEIAATLALGISVSVSGMLRPVFFPLSVWFLPFVWLIGSGNWKHRLCRVILYTIGPLLLLGGWLLYMRSSYHVVAPTTITGFSLVNNTGEYFEYLPDDVAAIRDTYIQYRDAYIAERGVHTNAIWEAIPAMTEASGLGFYKLSRELQRLSLKLISEHPDLYLLNVMEGWVSFWKAPVYWRPSLISSSISRTLLSALAIAGRVISVVANFAFLLFSCIALINQRVRARLGINHLIIAVSGMVWLTSVIQTLGEHGDNPRFLVPMQMVVIYVVVCVIWSWLRNQYVVKVRQE